ncbi:MAG TPA: MarR family winged helix-turn-helix transcriptional regulator, partial [Saprospiraceae bacterium]|nr:MarR family winged helix-turn-helix transcriptional regulator [Saprospiraceae bacterium]
MKYRLLESLLPHLEAYERAYPQGQGDHHFAVWLARHTADSDSVGVRDAEAPAPVPTDAAISQLLTFLHRYARSYTKKALEPSSLGTADEFAYLHTLIGQGPMSKSDLLQLHRHEKPTGMEIIRRLLAMGLISQRDDPHDRRSKLLTPTDAGRAVIAQTADGMAKAAQLLTGNLT